MRRFLLTYIVLTACSVLGIQAQRTLAPATPGRDQYGNQIDPSTQPDSLSSGTNIQSLPPKLYMWHLSETLGNRTIIPADTAALNYQNSNLVSGMRGHYNYLGNLGSPRISRIFFERDDNYPTIFLAPLSQFFFRPDQLNFTNSNVPYTNLTYYKAGDKLSGEERFKPYFSVNVNKQLAFGFNIDYLYGRGQYASQSTAYFNGGLFASYIGDQYQIQATYNNFYMKTNENGGITDDNYITHPENMAQGAKEYEPSNIPVRREQTTNRNQNFYVYLTQRYQMGFKRWLKKSTGEEVSREEKSAIRKERAEQERQRSLKQSSDSISTDSLGIMQNDSIAMRNAATIPDSLQMPQPDSLDVRSIRNRPVAPAAASTAAATADGDSIIEEFVPVTSIIHTFKIERSYRRYQANNESDTLYADPPYVNTNGSFSRDTTTAFSVKNILGIALLEGFNKYAKAGLTAYISHKYSRYDLMNRDSAALQRFTEQEIFVGGELAKRQGKTLHYAVDGEIGIMGKALGQFTVNGHADLNFRLGKDTVSFAAHGYVKNTLPSFYMRHYHSNHFFWDNDDMNKEMRTRVEGELHIDHWRTHLRAGIENIKNYTYFNRHAIPEQYSGNIQVVSAALRQDFKLGILHWDNEVIWQKTSDATRLPLPQLSVYSNFYLLTKLAKKVLTVQIGADVRYFSKYDAPDYEPATQQFHLQADDNRVSIGGYPIVNVYANLQLKRTRFFVMMYHVNQGMGARNYFLVPHYPINPRMLKFGISWNFYD
ncbi:MAG: putative porin [Prevotellaceae bacterium]|jgi:hypothetical protein|nr:putative porin [Prevotellaceae bacterium]